MYYRLTYQTTWLGHKAGDAVMCSKRPLDIGQSAECDVALPESDIYEPLVFATILPLEEGGWCIVRRTDCYDMSVNGEPLTTFVRLNDGDRLSFSGFGHSVELVFNIRTDSYYDDASGVVYHHSPRRRTFVLSTLLAVVAIAVACYAVLGKHGVEGIRGADLDKYNAYVYHIVADSVMLVNDTVIDGVATEVVVDRAALAKPLSGTCFLTDDGKFVTARHCIEPWVADETWDGVRLETMPVEVSMAVRAETANQKGEGHWRVRSHCTISRNGEVYEYMSDAFCIDRSRDLVMQLGTNENPLWLRTIIPVATRHDMELSDIAFADAPEIKGGFAMAKMEDMGRFDSQNNRDVAILGYPQKENDNELLTVTFGNSQHIVRDDAKRRVMGCIQMSAQINQGNSGGPILALIGNKIKVIGIVSKVDLYASQGTFWAVPVTEMVPRPKADEVENTPTNIYRR